MGASESSEDIERSETVEMAASSGWSGVGRAGGHGETVETMIPSEWCVSDAGSAGEAGVVGEEVAGDTYGMSSFPNPNPNPRTVIRQ